MDQRPSIGILSEIIPWFGSLPMACRESIWSHLHPNRYSQGERFSHSTNEQSLHLILQGRVKFYRWNPTTDRSMTLFIFGQGQLFPLFDMVSPKDVSVVSDDRIVSIEPLYTVSASISQWRGWWHEMPELQDIIQRMENMRIAELARKLEEAILYSVPERLIRLLERETQKRERYGFSLLEGLSQTEIAEQIGTSRVHLSRALKQLEQQKLVERKNRKIFIRDD